MPENIIIIPTEQLSDPGSEYYRELMDVRNKMKNQEEINAHERLIGLMAAVGGVRKDVFEFFLSHKFSYRPQVERCKDLFTRLAEVGWFELMFEEKSLKKVEAISYWQEALVRAYLAGIPLEEVRKMYIVAFTPIDLNNMIGVFLKNNVWQRKENVEENGGQKENSGLYAEELKEDLQELFQALQMKIEECISEVKKDSQDVIEEIKALKRLVKKTDNKKIEKERQEKEKPEESMRQDVAKPEEGMRQDVVKPEESMQQQDMEKPEESMQQQDMEKPEESMRQDVAKPEESMRQDVVKLEETTVPETGVCTINKEEAAKKQGKRLKLFADMYKKAKKNKFLAMGVQEKKSELFNILAEKKSSKEYMITISLLIKAEIDMGVLYDFIERETPLQDLKSILEAVNAEKLQKEETEDDLADGSAEDREDDGEEEDAGTDTETDAEDRWESEYAEETDYL